MGTSLLSFYMLLIQIEKSLTVFKILGEGVEKEPKGTMTINKRTGTIHVHKPVDYETFQVLDLTFQALNEENDVIDTQLGIEIEIVDANDNAPKFVQEVYEVSIPESTEQGTEVTTVKAVDVDTGNDGEVQYRMVSVMPKHDNVEFYLKEVPARKIAVIFFNGCLEHLKAKKYTILVEAKDKGTYVQHSSTTTVTVNIMDGNNHSPVITGITGPARVTEGEENVVVLNVQVTDEDYKGTPAWRAVYKIHGDTNDNFKITTDPKTNEGILTVTKHLDYEDNPKKHLNITVENEIPFHTCKVKTRTKSGLWDVVISRKDKSQPPFPVTVVVEDTNEAPVFLISKKQVSVLESSSVGRHLETFTAQDHDGQGQNKVQYKIENNPADWVTVDPMDGKVTISKPLDRESPFVKNNTYIVEILAFDDGKPPMTGTATLTIYIMDENDNAPTLDANTIDICQSDGQSMASIEASDIDEGINSGPFSFKLLGDVEGKWSVKPQQGYSTSLVKESNVPSGHHELEIEVSDLQSNSAVHNLFVTVCNCVNPKEPNCRIRKSTSVAAGAPVIGIIFFALLLIAGVLLLSFLVSCKKKHAMIKEEEGSGRLMNSNIETRGTDCKSSGRRRKYSAEHSNFTIINGVLPKVLNQKLYVLQASGEELYDYAPHEYTEEKNSEPNDSLDAISILDTPFDPESLLGLDSRFNHLASISMLSKKPESTSL
ncbi:B-cadherin-like [Xyrichtys novacula]|uniref:B-cadherin-like n=1 Tax=Xyrichtys novacula TaxID=13765 RepID=A0AAV1HI23_XYRNO|nr:B-cadherin-like [Xyrichtys novacula]